jgi:2-polyprenyl-6-methoxyphenol hydroxylase-like FAD-dependent oxidoreductase
VAQAKVPGTQDTHYQVVVVGAGPTGLITTNLLGQDGIKTLLVEQDESTCSALHHADEIPAQTSVGRRSRGRYFAMGMPFVYTGTIRTARPLHHTAR